MSWLPTSLWTNCSARACGRTARDRRSRSTMSSRCSSDSGEGECVIAVDRSATGLLTRPAPSPGRAALLTVTGGGVTRLLEAHPPGVCSHANRRVGTS